MTPRERVDIALVADSPGELMFHCHILEDVAAMTTEAIPRSAKRILPLIEELRQQ